MSWAYQFTEDELIEGIRQGGTQEGVFIKQLYQDNWLELQQALTEKGVDTQMAKDLYQDAVVVLYKHIKKGHFNNESPIGYYLQSICDALLTKQKTGLVASKTGQNKLESDPFIALMDPSLQQAAKEALGKLDTDYQKLLLYSIFYEYNMSEISMSMGFPKTFAAQDQKEKALEQLKSLLESQPQLLAKLQPLMNR